MVVSSACESNSTPTVLPEKFKPPPALTRIQQKIRSLIKNHADLNKVSFDANLSYLIGMNDRQRKIVQQIRKSKQTSVTPILTKLTEVHQSYEYFLITKVSNPFHRTMNEWYDKTLNILMPALKQGKKVDIDSLNISLMIGEIQSYIQAEYGIGFESTKEDIPAHLAYMDAECPFEKKEYDKAEELDTFFKEQTQLEKIPIELFLRARLDWTLLDPIFAKYKDRFISKDIRRVELYKGEDKTYAVHTTTKYHILIPNSETKEAQIYLVKFYAKECIHRVYLTLFKEKVVKAYLDCFREEEAALKKLQTLLVRYNEGVEQKMKTPRICTSINPNQIPIFLSTPEEKEQLSTPKEKIKTRRPAVGEKAASAKAYPIDQPAPEPHLIQIFYLNKDDYRVFMILIKKEKGKVYWNEAVTCFSHLKWEILPVRGSIYKFKFDKHRLYVPHLNFASLSQGVFRESIQMMGGDIAVHNNHKPHDKYLNEPLDPGRLSSFCNLLKEAGFNEHNVQQGKTPEPASTSGQTSSIEKV